MTVEVSHVNDSQKDSSWSPAYACEEPCIVSQLPYSPSASVLRCARTAGHAYFEGAMQLVSRLGHYQFMLTPEILIYSTHGMRTQHMQGQRTF